MQMLSIITPRSPELGHLLPHNEPTPPSCDKKTDLGSSIDTFEYVNKSMCAADVTYDEQPLPQDVTASLRARRAQYLTVRERRSAARFSHAGLPYFFLGDAGVAAHTLSGILEPYKMPGAAMEHFEALRLPFEEREARSLCYIEPSSSRLIELDSWPEELMDDQRRALFNCLLRLYPRSLKHRPSPPEMVSLTVAAASFDAGVLVRRDPLAAAAIKALLPEGDRARAIQGALRYVKKYGLDWRIEQALQASEHFFDGIKPRELEMPSFSLFRPTTWPAYLVLRAEATIEYLFGPDPDEPH